MIERLHDLPAGVEGVSAKGRVTAHDYRATVWPIFDAAKRGGQPIRFLYHVAADADFTAGAALEDARLGFGDSLDSLQRCALVSDAGWMRNAASFFASVAPCPIRIFGESEWDQATGWLADLAAPDRIPHELLPDSGILVIRPNKKIDAEDIETIDATVDAWLKTAAGELNGVIIHAKTFPGWESLGGFLRHARFVRDHQSQIRRLALVADGKLAELAAVFATRLVKAKVRHFAYRDFSAAVDWVEAPPETKRSGREERSGPIAAQFRN